MKLLTLLLLLFVSCISFAQNARWIKVCDMKDNGRSDEYRLVIKDNIDTTVVLIDSVIYDSVGKIKGWNVKGGIVLLKEKPKVSVTTIDTIFGGTKFYTPDLYLHNYYSPNRVYSKRGIKRKPHKPTKRKPVSKHRNRSLCCTATNDGYEDYKAGEGIKGTYFKGYGEVYDMGNGYVLLVNPKGTFYKKKKP